jgi:hypothetical protein
MFVSYKKVGKPKEKKKGKKRQALIDFEQFIFVEEAI